MSINIWREKYYTHSWAFSGDKRGIYYGNGFSEEYLYNDIEKVAEVWYNHNDGTLTFN